LRPHPLWLAAALIGASLTPHAARSQARPALDINTEPAVTLTRDGLALELAFHDEFDALVLESPERVGWTPHFAHGPADQLDERTLRNNRELQIYVDPAMRWGANSPAPQTLAVRDGVLQLTAHRVAESQESAIWDYQYASGMVSSHRLYRQTYGYFEMRARLPAGRGLWPAFWLLPQSGRWPPELDVLEALGDDTHAYYASYHAGVGAGRTTRTSKIEPGADLSAGFHDYGLLWTREALIYFFDGEEVARYPTPADMHEPMYLLLNLAIGGVWAGAPDARTQFPARYEIDAVRVYRLSRDAGAITP
jgi:beta-glucanase (GH16 family)